MAQYLIRTDGKEKKTSILRLGDDVESTGLVYTDFKLNLGIRDISSEDVVNPLTKRSIGQINLYTNQDVISVNHRGEELSALSLSGEYRENGLAIPYKKLTKDILFSKPEYRSLEDMGITHAYFLGKGSALSHVFCFEREGDASGLVYTRERDDVSALRGLSLSLAQRIGEQEFIFEFMRK